MKQITLRLPDDLHAWLKDLAEREHRSLHSQVLHMLETGRPARHSGPDAEGTR
ncbi:Arc family DNA-binding protein [Streptomyces sp. MBT65]|uniref:Arc family DNA-binding protein n=1 Tax=Streptomyces sp. MBT65 TaxID=1488395 RepID=UPI00190A900D|nr:Arc family DNA-binding protein [Streptomyces sp. MBT65]MBK3576099.1 Arc family DNA-binding protein [Streptomyces sp. MBT65]